MRKLRAGVIGLGVGNQHATAFREHDDVDLVAVCDLDAGKVTEAQAKWPGVTGFDCADKLLASGLDVVAIASYDHDHVEQVVKALDAGIHVFAEKPLCLSDDELDSIGDALDRHSRLRLSSNTILRRSPRFIELHESIAKGALGSLFYVEADYVYGRFRKITHGWRGVSPGYSVVLSGGIHMIDLLRWLTGERIVEVAAFGNRIAGEAAQSPFRGQDLVAALLRFESGMTGKVTANFASVHPHFHRVLMYGTRATFENRLGSAELWQSGDPAIAPEMVETPYPAVRKGDLIPSFIDGILGKGAPLVNEEDVFETMQSCLAVNRSLREGKSIRVPPPRRFGRPN